jgi:hypothetical protein
VEGRIYLGILTPFNRRSLRSYNRLSHDEEGNSVLLLQLATEGWLSCILMVCAHDVAHVAAVLFTDRRSVSHRPQNTTIFAPVPRGSFVAVLGRRILDGQTDKIQRSADTWNGTECTCKT